LPRQLYDGKQKYLTLGLPDTPINRKAAEAKARLIEADILYERFDYTFERYGKAPSHLTVVESLKVETVDASQLWEKFFASKRLGLKPKTIEKYQNFQKLFAKLDGIPITDALEIKAKLEKVTTVSRTKDSLMYLSAACKWAIKHGLLNINPFDGMASEMPKYGYMTDPSPNAFTEEEQDRIIEAFKNDSRKGMNHRHYAPFVEFLFLTGV
jgi:integrase